MFAAHVNPPESTEGLGNKWMASKKLGLFLQIVAGDSRHGLADARLGLVQGHGVHENANVASLAMHRCQGSGFSFPHADLEQVP
jgi:hypothetical protein